MSIAAVESHRVTTAATTDVGAAVFDASAFQGELMGIVIEDGTVGLISVYDDANDTTNLIAQWTPPALTVQAGNHTDFFGRHLRRGLTIVTASDMEYSVYVKYIGMPT